MAATTKIIMIAEIRCFVFLLCMLNIISPYKKCRRTATLCVRNHSRNFYGNNVKL